MTRDQEAEYLDTLGEAYAAAGRFDDATKACRKAIDLAAAAGHDDLAEQMRGRLSLYESHRPYTEATAS